ncbi:MAG: hypothetical protein JNK37_20925 [Verrucomicrobiales bacterium]|nr:hypothetical protein [Verrucomicrobiales bacterium]
MNPIETIDARLRDWSLGLEAEEKDWPALIPRTTLRLAGYYESFPHLLMTAAANERPGWPVEHLAATDYDLSPAVCYHAYASLHRHTLTDPEGGIVLAARGRCFRREDPATLMPGRRQIEFQMRELIFIGAPQWIDRRLGTMRDDIGRLARELGIEGGWEEATDPFFLPQTKSRAKAALQRLLKTKIEFTLADGLSIASINRHRDFFGGRFQISLTDGKPAHSACVAFGLERWVTASSLR